MNTNKQNLLCRELLLFPITCAATKICGIYASPHPQETPHAKPDRMVSGEALASIRKPS